MTMLEPAVKKETLLAAAWTIVLSLVMEAVFLLLGKWEPAVLFGNLGGGAAAVANILILGLTISKALEGGEQSKAMMRVEMSKRLRLLGIALICALLIGVLKTNVYATLIPLLFPRVGMMFRGGRGLKGSVETIEANSSGEGSDLID